MLYQAGTYQIIYADPPWQYNDTQESGGTAYFGAAARYDTMPLEDIKALPVDQLAGKDCALFLWAVSPLLPEAFELIEAWGFKYKTLAFVWSKITKNGKYVSNMGRWTMGNVEICLLATRGQPKRKKNNVKQLVLAKRCEHSRKPDVVRQRIVELIGDVPRIELFARGDRMPDLFGENRFDGWDIFGNEAEGNLEL